MCGDAGDGGGDGGGGDVDGVYCFPEQPSLSPNIPHEECLVIDYVRAQTLRSGAEVEARYASLA